MRDSFGREINYLRISVTQRCNLNCLYCGSEVPDLNELSVDEIREIVSAFARCGITKVRLTGGEPLVRKDIVSIASAVKGTDQIEKTVLTTNGVFLKEYAYELKQAGVDAVNISIDTLDRDEYKHLTGKDCLDRVLDGIQEAEKVGLKVRTNSVLIRGENDGDAGQLIELAREHKIDVRFIELMPFSDAGKNEKLIVKGKEILQQFPFLQPVPDKTKNTEPSVARYYSANGFTGQIGLINPVSEKFCDACNRIRLLSDGKLKPCLGHEETVNIRPYIGDPQKLIEVIRTAIQAKPKGHEFNCGYGSSHAMNKIGG